MKSKRNVGSNVKKYYLFSFFSELVFFIPIIVLFWQSNGLSLTQIMLLQSLYAISVVLLEVPTGVVADKIGRKQSLVCGGFFSIIGFVSYALGHNFWQFLIAEMILALANSFISGADSAFIYDSLKEQKQENNFKKVRGNGKSLEYFAAAFASVCGGFIAIYGLRLNFWLTVFGMILAFFVMLSLVEPKRFSKVLNNKSYWKHTKESFRELFKTKQLLFLILFNGLLVIMLRTSLWFYQPYMKSSGLALAYFGIVWASFNLFAILGSKSAHRFEKYLGEKWSLWFMGVGIVLSLVFMSFWFALFGLLFICFQQFIRGFIPPVIESYTHKHLSSEKRATLMSIQNMTGSLMFAIAGPIYGKIADVYSLSTALLVTALSVFVALVLLMIWNRKNNSH